MVAYTFSYACISSVDKVVHDPSSLWPVQHFVWLQLISSNQFGLQRIWSQWHSERQQIFYHTNLAWNAFVGTVISDMTVALISKPTFRARLRVTSPYLTPATRSNLFPKLISFFQVETHKVSTSIREGFHILLHKPCHEEVHSARSTCTAPERVRKRFESGWKQNRFADILRWEFHLFLSEQGWARFTNVIVKWFYGIEFP